MTRDMIDNILSVCSFTFSRSGGKGGQHVNKTETKVQLSFPLEQCTVFDEGQKVRIRKKLKNRFDTEGILHLSSQESRSQIKNKERVQQKLIELLETALIPPRKRKVSKPSKAQKEVRLKEKKQLSDKKQLRRKPPL